MLRLITIIFSLLLCGCFATSPSVYPALDFHKRALTKSPRVALVLGGGGARGFAHLGVIKALEEQHIPIDLIVGTSAGSLVGGLYAADPHIDAVTDTMMKSSYLDYIDISISQAMSGPIRGTQLQQFIAKNTSDCPLEKTRIPFIAVSTDLNSGRTIPISKGSLALAVNASCAIPSVVQPVRFANITLVDGGVTDPVPVDIAKTYHPKIIIAVNIASDPRNPFSLTAPNILSQSIDLMMQALTRYNLGRADVVIRPDVGCASMFDLSHKQKLYAQGLAAGRRAIPQIKKLLATAP